MTTEVLARARAGDQDAFCQLTEPHRRELQAHCYRILGSAQDAEDAVQETLLAAWRGLGGFEERSSVRTWLYRVATNRCLNALRDGPRRPPFTETVPPTVMWPEPSRLSEVVWLEPFADFTLDDVADPALGPETRYEAREAISLAFIAALQHLPPRQRAVLVLRDVLGYHTAEVADMLESTEDSVNSALKRARAALDGRLRASRQREPAPLPRSPAEEALVERFTNAFVAGDVAGVVALLTEDVQLTMPPIPLEYYGRELVAHFHSSVVFQGGRRYQLVATRANRQPAFGLYVTDHHAPIAHCNGLLVLTLAGPRICALTRFDNSVLPHFGLPRTLGTSWPTAPKRQ
jgi:RNA polymerase sigma-70 factor (TIGR02960 family)